MLCYEQWKWKMVSKLTTICLNGWAQHACCAMSRSSKCFNLQLFILWPDRGTNYPTIVGMLEASISAETSTSFQTSRTWISSVQVLPYVSTVTGRPGSKCCQKSQLEGSISLLTAIGHWSWLLVSFVCLRSPRSLHLSLPLFKSLSHWSQLHQRKPWIWLTESDCVWKPATTAHYPMALHWSISAGKGGTETKTCHTSLPFTNPSFIS